MAGTEVFLSDEVKSKPKPEHKKEVPKRMLDYLEKKTGNVTIVVMGKSGAGKSSLLRNIFPEIEKPKKMLDAKPETQKIDIINVEKGGIELKVVDTVGFDQESKVRKKQLKELADETNKRADLVVFCIPVGPGSRFVSDTPQMMKSLQLAYGKNIWRHCLVVFTYSNLAWEHIKGEEDAVRQYKEHIKEYTTLFQQELDKQIPSPDVTVKCIFTDCSEPSAPPPSSSEPSPSSSMSSSPSSGEASVLSDEQLQSLIDSLLKESHEIVTMPAGKNETDKVLPGFQEGWTDRVFAGMLASTVAEAKMDLLKFRYTTEFIKRAIMCFLQKKK